MCPITKEVEVGGEEGCNLEVSKQCSICQTITVMPCNGGEPELECECLVEEECGKCRRTVQGLCRELVQCR